MTTTAGERVIVAIGYEFDFCSHDTTPCLRTHATPASPAAATARCMAQGQQVPRRTFTASQTWVLALQGGGMGRCEMRCLITLTALPLTATWHSSMWRIRTTTSFAW